MLHILHQIAKTGIKTEPAPAPAEEMVVVARLQEKILRMLGRALTIRQVDAGSCNGCELEIHALGNPYYNIEGLGIRFVASPRHADMLLVTGPVSKHMAIALKRTYDATPDPKLVVAVGDCGCTGGIFGESYASLGRVGNVLPVDVEIPGCPQRRRPSSVASWPRLACMRRRPHRRSAMSPRSASTQRPRTSAECTRRAGRRQLRADAGLENRGAGAILEGCVAVDRRQNQTLARR